MNLLDNMESTHVTNSEETKKGKKGYQMSLTLRTIININMATEILRSINQALGIACHIDSSKTI
jgi:hypothetical protein